LELFQNLETWLDRKTNRTF